MRRHVVGVMGGGEVGDEDLAVAYEIGRLIAANGWILLNGGINTGVSDASAKGAREAGGLAVGVLPGENRARLSDNIDIAIVTGIGSARNNINVLSSDIIIVCSGAAGTLSEAALALKARRKFIVLGTVIGRVASEFAKEGQVVVVGSADEAIDAASAMLTTHSGNLQDLPDSIE